MKAITRIEITNFQSHASTVIEPSSAGKLTVLTGPTDSGKSAVFRALRWLYYGGPVYARTGCSMVSVSVRLADDTVVTRYRSGSTNRYVVDRPGEEPQIFEGFGREIPLEVQQALGVRPLDIAGLSLEVNLARQHDPAFLVSSVSAPARAKALGQIAGVEAVDLAMRSAGRDIFEGQRELRQVEAEVADLEEQVRQYDYLAALARRIELIERLVNRLEAAEQRRTRLVDLKGRMARLNQDGKQWEAVRRRTAGAAVALVAIDRTQGSATRRSALARIQRTLVDCAARESEAKVVVARTAGAGRAMILTAEAERRVERCRRLGSIQELLARIDADRARLYLQAEAISAKLVAVRPVIEMAEAEVQRLAAIRRIDGVLRQTRDDRVLWTRKRDDAASAAQTARDAYAKALMDAGRCPTCGGPIHHDHLKEVV